MKPKYLGLSLVLLSSLLTGCQNSGGIVGGDIEVKLLETHHEEYILGNLIDVGEFFYCSDRSAASITVTYLKNDNSVTETIVGTTFFPAVAGNHHFVLKANNKKIEKDIEVVYQMPSIEIADANYIAKVDSQIYFADVYVDVPVKYSPESADLTVKTIEYSPYDFRLTAEETTYTEKVTMKARYFDGSKAGRYRMTLEVVNGSRTTEGYIYIFLTNSDRPGNSKIASDDGMNISNYVATDPSNDNNFILPRAAEFDNATYFAPNGDFSPSNPLGLEFKGKSIPSFGLLVKPNVNSGSYGPLSISDGYCLSFSERSTEYFTVYGHNKEMFKGGDSKPGSFGVDDLDDDKYYYFELSFTSEFDEYASSKKPYYHNLEYSLYEIENYGTSNEKLSDEPLYVLKDIGGWYDAYEANGNYLMIYGSSSRDITIKLNNR